MKLTRKDLQWRLIAVAVMVSLGIWLGRRQIMFQIRSDVFFETKAAQDHRFNGVFIGSSRIYRGLNPAIFEKLDPGSTYYNFGFSSLEFTTRYLRRVDELLTDKSTLRTIVIGMDPSSFSRFSHDRDTFGAASAHPLLDRIARGILVKVRKSSDPAENPITYHQSGWVSVANVQDKRSEGLKQFGQRFVGPAGDILDEDVQSLVEAIRRWRSQGVNVFALRMPTSVEMERSEDRLLRFDRTKMRKITEAAGALWIDLPNNDNETLDSSHLTADGATRVSEIVASEIIRRRSN